MIFKDLGVILKNGAVKNHRTVLKIILNPILRVVRLEISSIFEKNKFIRYKLRISDKFRINIFKNYYESLFYK